MAEHVQLGYASTIHGAQGGTVDTTHTVLTGTETRQGLYVALSRGRQANHLYLGAPAASLDGIGPDVQEASAEPRQVLTDILARDGRALSATSTERGNPAQELRQAVLAYQDALVVLAQHHLGGERMTALDHALEKWLPGLTGQPAYPHLRGQLALHWVDGSPPQAVIQKATTWYPGAQSLTEADDPAAALAWRITTFTPPSHRDAPLPWLPDTPPALRQQPATNDYLDRLTHRIDDLKQRVADGAQGGAADRAPWQRTLPPDTDDQLLADLAIWRAAHHIPPTEPRPTGPPAKEPHAARHQTGSSQMNQPPSRI